MSVSKYLRNLALTLAILFACAAPVSAATYWECSASGMEKNGLRKADLTFRLDLTGKIVSGEIKFSKVVQGKISMPGGDYVYSGGGNVSRDDGTYEWIMQGNWTGIKLNCDNSTANNHGTVMIRKLKIQNIAEMELKSKEGSIWFLFPHGCEYKQVTIQDPPST